MHRVRGAPLAAWLIAMLCWACDPRPTPVDDAPGGPAPSVSRPVSRSVRLASGVIVLGEPLARSVATAGPGDTIVSLPRGSFGGAERIVVHLDADGIVRGLTFDYLLGADFDAMVADYEEDLGPPARSTEIRQGEEPAHVATWRDGRTELRLVRDPNRSAWTIRAALRDLARR